MHFFLYVLSIFYLSFGQKCGVSVMRLQHSEVQLLTEPDLYMTEGNRLGIPLTFYCDGTKK